MSTPTNDATAVPVSPKPSSPPPQTGASSSYPPFRRRALGRAASPPTWAWYEQIPMPSDDDEEDENSSDSESDAGSEDSESDAGETMHFEAMEVDEPRDDEEPSCQHQDKGKARAVEPPVVVQRKEKRHRRARAPECRPILTIHRSQGFVWNQDLFVPSYIKDRYVTSTSPPGESCISLTNPLSANSPNPYDVEVVEIRLTEDDFIF